MRVLIINRDVGTGSVGKICEDLYYGIKSCGHECKIAYSWKNRSTIPSEDLIQFGGVNLIRITALLARLFDSDGLHSKRATKRLLKEIDRYSPDIVHLHGCFGYYLNYQLLFEYLKNKNIRVISTLHCCWDFTGHCCYFTKAQCEKWKSGCFSCPEKRSYPKSILFDNSKKNYKLKKNAFTALSNYVIVTPSKWLAEMVRESFLKEAKTLVVNNGIDTEVFKPTQVDLGKYGIDTSKKIILGVASVWNSRKGIDDFLDLARELDANYQIVIVGLKEKQIEKMPQGIVCIKRTDSKEELAAIYSAATVLFNPTYEDNYPTVNLEAIACGTPVVTYNTGGSPEAVLSFDGGKIIKQKDYAALLSYLRFTNKRIVVNEKMRKELSKERMVAQYIDIYKALNDGKEV